MTPQELNDIRENFYTVIEDFKQTWPLSRVQNMTLQEYTNLNRSDSFCYWLEAKTHWSGSIWGGSAFKFGIYEKSNKATQFSAQGRMSDENYAWMSKYGDSREEAFEKVRSTIVQIIQLSQSEQFEEIEKLDLGDAVKWKIAFLYSDFKLFTVYKKDKLVELASKLSIPLNKSASFYELQKAILASKPTDKDFLDFYMEMLTLLEPSKSEIQYWIYSPGEQAYKWEEFYYDGIMALGWDELKPLDEYTGKDEITEDLRKAYGGEGSKKNDTTANDDFASKMKVGDVVFVKKGRSRLLGYGVVESDYYFDDQREDYKHCRKVRWEKKGNWTVDDHSLVLKTLTDITGYSSEISKGQKYHEFLLAKMTDIQVATADSSEASLLRYKKQIILQGPPGTGKTREAKLIAREMIGLTENEHISNHEQFKLIQFHPSYTYEDFVRGIVSKPNPEGDGIVYEAENKTLAAFAEAALVNYKEATQKIPVSPVADVFEAFIENVKDEMALDINHKYPITDAVYLFAADETRFKYKGDNWVAHQKGLNMKFSELKQIIEANITERQAIKKMTELEELTRQHATYFLKVAERFYEFRANHKAAESKSEVVPLKNYVLVIDEINRANLSSVLGELIYALEYRGEEVESMYEVDGSQKLILPPNLYIIGTMNTADRSVGHIDYAIKRRFAFVDVLPEVLENSDDMIFNKELFEKVSRLFITNLEEYKANPSEKLKRAKTLSPEFRPEDIWLGHSYFIQKKGKDENGNEILIPQNFSMRLEYEIKPILQEYVKDGVLISSVTITEGGQESEIPVDQYIHSL